MWRKNEERCEAATIVEVHFTQRGRSEEDAFIDADNMDADNRCFYTPRIYRLGRVS